MNKKGNLFGVIAFFSLIAFILLVGFVLVVGVAIVDFVYDTAVPELTGLGVIGGSNFTQFAEITIQPLNRVVQSLTWAAGVFYLILLISSIGFGVIVSRNGVSTWLLGMFLGLAILLLITSMLMSNIYEDFYNDTGELADRLREQVLLSYMILYSPLVITSVIFIVGIIMFSGIGRQEVF